MKESVVCAVVLGLICATSLVAQTEPALVPFSWDWERTSESALDLSRFLDAPAGKGGFVRVQDGHFSKPDGSRLRLWGVNLTSASGTPDKELAPRIAEDLARMGFNIARFHHLDAAWGNGLFPSDSTDTRAFDTNNLDRFDFLFAELKKRGIYVSLTMNVLRRFKEGDDVRDWKILSYGKGATYYNPRILKLQHEFTRHLLTHKNPYTGLEYRHEPAIVSIEMMNENSLIEAWYQGRLVGQENPASGTWAPLPVSYAEELTEQFNAWLKTNRSSEVVSAIRKETGVGPDALVPRLAPSQFTNASALRFHTEAEFLMNVESNYFAEMKRLIRDEIGSKSLLFGSADHNDGFAGYAHVSSMLQLDVIDGHGYWEHPETGPLTRVKNTPMVNNPLDSPFTQFARTPVAGMPFTVSEVNHPYPHKFAAEGYVTLSAYAQFHDWDGIAWFTWSRGRLGKPEQGQPARDCFEISQDPVRLAQITIAGLMWHRKDLSTALQTLIRTYTHDEMIEALRLTSWKYRPFFKPGFDLTTPLKHATRWKPMQTASGEQGAGESSPYTQPAPANIESDTRELHWLHADQKRGVIKVATPRTQSLIGFVKGSGETVPHLSAAISNEFCSITLSSLDDLPIAQSRKLLLVATTGTGQNTGQRFAEDGKTMVEWGKGPLLIEPVTGSIALRGLRKAGSLKATPLTPEGRPQSAKILARRSGNEWTLPVGDPPTTWWIIEATD